MALNNQRAIFAQFYTDITTAVTFGNATQSAVQAKYSKKTAKSQGQRLLTKVDIKQEIARIEELGRLETVYELKQAISAIDLRIGYLEPAAEKGSIAATSAITALLREKNVITGLTKLRVVDETEQAQEIADTDKAQADMIAKYLLKQSIAKEA